MWHPKNSGFLALLATLVTMMLGCEQPPQPFVPKSAIAPEVVYCNDNTGHKPGSRPWVLGGTCCCTPSDALMEQLQRDGQCVGTTAEQLAEQYRQAEIVLRGPGHRWCNGMCAAGPHVVLGGKCMCPPTPGTDYYEQIVTGRGAVARGEAKQ